MAVAIFDQTHLKAPARSRRHWEFGSFVASQLTNFPSNVRTSVAATCRFQIMGWNKGNHNGSAPRNVGDPLPFVGSGRWCYTRMQSYGFCPDNFRTCGPKSSWAESNSFAGANEILGLFGLSMKQVLDYYGDVPADGKLQFDLMDILNDMLPAFGTRSKITA